MQELVNFHQSAPSPSGMNGRTRRGPSLFKYYIHDSVQALRFELTGEFGEIDIEELNGCWRTAKTTLGTRKFIIDLRKLKAVDDSGRQWLSSMSSQGASFLPEGQFQPNAQFSGSQNTPDKARSGVWERLVGLCRGVRVSVAKSSTQAP